MVDTQGDAIARQLASGAFSITAPSTFEGIINQGTVTVNGVDLGALLNGQQQIPGATPVLGAQPAAPEAPPPEALPPVGALNLNIDLGGIETPMDQLANNISLRVTEGIQALIDQAVELSAQPLERKRSAFTQTVRA